jgi:hypothetical protein
METYTTFSALSSNNCHPIKQEITKKLLKSSTTQIYSEESCRKQTEAEAEVVNVQ